MIAYTLRRRRSSPNCVPRCRSHYHGNKWLCPDIFALRVQCREKPSQICVPKRPSHCRGNARRVPSRSSIITELRTILKDSCATRAISRNAIYSKTDIQNRNKNFPHPNLTENLFKLEIFECLQCPRGGKSLHPYSRDRILLNRKRKQVAECVKNNTTEDTPTRGWSKD